MKNFSQVGKSIVQGQCDQKWGEGLASVGTACFFCVFVLGSARVV